MFYDEAKIYIRSGDGGNGMSSFRREKFVPYGGPDGGDGGKGGDVIFKVNPKLNTLAYFHRRVHFKATHGTRGGRSNQTGRQGEPLILSVPPGTIIRDAETEQLLADLTHAEQEIALLPGGAGGRGNARFASSTNQAPKVAEKGVQGHERWVTMELKLIADVGLLGKPNAGKSTLLAKVSAAKPKIANYPFTTLQPNLGVVDLDDYQSFVMADIPGLIEGAANGIGLGHDFLRHIERNRILIHLLDGMASEPLEDFKGLNEELKLYSPALAEKPQLVVLNKMDTPDGQAWEPLIQEEVEALGYEFMSISAVTGANVREMLYRVKELIDALPETPLRVEEEVVVIRPKSDPDQFTIDQLAEDNWVVRGETIERIAAQTYFDIDAAAIRFQRILDRMGVNTALKKAGVKDGDMVWFGEIELEWQAEE